MCIVFVCLLFLYIDYSPILGVLSTYGTAEKNIVCFILCKMFSLFDSLNTKIILYVEPKNNKYESVDNAMHMGYLH